MCDKLGDKYAKKMHSTISDRRGFTLVELCVVLALVAIVTTMIATFSVLINRYSQDNANDYAFYEQCFEYKKEFEKDVTGKSISSFDCEGNKDRNVGNYDQIEKAEFEIEETDGKLIKCTLTGKNDQTFTFVVYPRIN